MFLCYYAEERSRRLTFSIFRIPQLMLHPSLNALRRSVRVYHSRTLLCQLITLQYSSDNAHAIELLEAACAACVLEWNTHRAAPSRTDLEALIAGTSFNSGLVSKLDDPHEHLFTADFQYRSENHSVFPGPTLGGTRPLEAVRDALEYRPEAYDARFLHEVSSLIRGVLKLSTHVIRQAGLPANVEPTGWHRDAPGRPARTPLVTLLTGDALHQCLAACTITSDVLRCILTPDEVAAVKLHLTRSLPDLQSVMQRHPTEALKRAPVLALDDQWLLLAPHALLAATVRKVLHLVQQADQGAIFDQHLTVTRLVDTQFAMARLGCEPLLIHADQEHTPGTSWYALDTDKIISVTNVIQRAGDIDTSRILGQWAPELPAEPPHAPEPIHAPHVLHLLVMCDLGDGYRVPLPRSWSPAQVIALRPDDLAILAATHRQDSTVFWRLQRSRVAFREAVRFRFDNPIDEIALLSQWDFPRSFPFPQHTLVSVNGQIGADWRRKSAAARHEHVVRWIDGEHVMPVERGLNMPPTVYSPLMPIWSEEHVLVEQNGHQIWILDDRGHELWDVAERADSHDPELSPLVQALPDFVQAVAVWLTHLLPALQHGQSLSGRAQVTTVLVGVEHHAPPCGVQFDRERRTIRLTLAPAFLDLLQHADNRAERELVRALARALRRLWGEPAHPEHIDPMVESVAPLGDKRITMRHQSALNTQLDPRDLVPVRYLRAGEQHEWAVYAGQRLAQRHRWKPGPITPATSQIPIEANEVLYQELQARLATLDGELLLPFLLEHLETIRFEHEQLITSRISRELIFGASTKPFHPASDATAVALRFLLEVIAARLPTGITLPSLTTLDELMGLAALITLYGQAGDALRYGVGTVNLCVEVDGSLTMEADEYTRAMQTLRASALKEGALQANRERYAHAAREARAIPDGAHDDVPTEEGTLHLMDGACRALYQVGIDELMHVMFGALALGDGHEGGVIILSLQQFMDQMHADTGLSTGILAHALDALSLCERADFLIPPDGFPRSEVMPWQFNRALSLLKRPFIRTTIRGTPHIAWGNRALDASRRFWMEDQFLAGRLHKGAPLHPGAKQAAQAMGRLNTRRGQAFNAAVAAVLSAAGFDVLENVTGFGKLKLREGGDTLGDIDVCAWHAHRRQLLLLECKAYAPARTPLELHGQLQEFLYGKSRAGKAAERPLTEKHLRRAQFVERHLTDVLTHLGVQEAAGWVVRPAYVMSNLPNELLARQAPYPIIHLDALSSFIEAPDAPGMSPSTNHG